MATAYLRIKVDRVVLNQEIQAARRTIIANLSALKIPVQIIPTVNRRALATAFGSMSAPMGVKGGGGVPIGGAPKGATNINSDFGGMMAGVAGRRPSVQNPFTAVGANREGRADRFKSAGGFAKGSAQIGAGILGAQAAMMVLRAPVEMVKIAADFEKAMIRVKLVTQATDDEMKALKDTAMKLGRETTFTAREVAASMVTLGQMGLSASEVDQVANTVMKFAAAGRVSTEESAATLLGAVNAMDIGLGEIGRVADVLTRAALRSPADAEKIAISFRYIGPIAKMAGMQIEDLAGAIGLLAKMNLPGSTIGTGFRRAISELAKGDSAEKIGKLLGRDVELRFDDGRLKELPDILDEINKSFTGVTAEQDRLTFAMELMGLRGGPQFAFLLNQGGDALRDMQAKMNDLGITAESIADKEMQSFYGAVDRIKAAWERFSVAFMDSGLLDTVASLIDGLSYVVDLAAEGVETIGRIKLPPGLDVLLGLGMPSRGKNLTNADEMERRLLEIGVLDSSVVDGNKPVGVGAGLFGAMGAGAAAGLGEKSRGQFDFVPVFPEFNEEMEKAAKAFDETISQGRFFDQMKAAEDQMKNANEMHALLFQEEFEKKKRAEEEAMRLEEERRMANQPQFTGLAELSRQIQLSILRPDKEQKVQEDIKKNTRDSVDVLIDIDERLTNLNMGFA